MVSCWALGEPKDDAVRGGALNRKCGKKTACWEKTEFLEAGHTMTPELLRPQKMALQWVK